jgi:hypothetical protein
MEDLDDYNNDDIEVFDVINGLPRQVYYGGQKISAVIFPSFQKNRCSPFLIVIMIDVFTCHF